MGRAFDLHAIIQSMNDSEVDTLRDVVVRSLNPSDAAAFTEFCISHTLADIRLVLSTKYADITKKHIARGRTSEYLGGVDHALLEAAASTAASGVDINRYRDACRDERQTQGWRFIWIGTALILSNLVIIPAMALITSKVVEHPAADSMDRLASVMLQVTPAADDAVEQGAAKSNKTIETLSLFSGYLSSVDGRLKEMKEMADRISDESEGLPELRRGMREVSEVDVAALATRLTTVAPSGAAPAVAPTATDAEKVATALVAMGMARQIGASSLSLDERRVTASEYIVLRKNSPGFTSVQSDLRSIDKVSELQRQIQNSVTQMQDIVRELKPAVLDPKSPGSGVIDSLLTDAPKFKSVSNDLNSLVTSGIKIAKDARGATDTLKSTATFVAPYAFTVLAVGAMFVTLGVTSVLRSTKLNEELYEEAASLGQTLMLSRLATELKMQGMNTEAIVERIARVGERTKRSEGGIPLPLARAVAELAKAIKER